MEFIEQNGVLLPRQYAELEELPETACPAAEAHHFKDTLRPAIRCRVANNSFALAEGGNAAAMWCCNPDGYSDCPVWRERHRANGPS